MYRRKKRMQNKRPAWEAKWIWTRGKTPYPFHVSYFRRCFELDRRPKSCLLHC